MSEVPTLQLVFEGPMARRHQVPASALTQALSGLQRAIHLLAMQHEGVEVRRRDRVSRDIEDKYPLLCSPPSACCVELRVQVGDPTSGLFAFDDIQRVTDTFERSAKAVAAGDRAAVFALLPDRIRRRRVLEALGSMLPRAGSGIDLTLRSGVPAFEVRGEQLAHSMRELFVAEGGAQVVQTITGRLTRIDFDQRKITIVYPPTQRDLECYCDESVEELLLENPRAPIQVTGTVVFDENNDPKRIVEVQDIREMDLSPFLLTQLRCGGRTLRFRQPRELRPELDDTEQLMCLRDDALGIDVCASKREDLLDDLRVELDVLWRNYALEDDEALTPRARSLKRSLLVALEEADAPA